MRRNFKCMSTDIVFPGSTVPTKEFPFCALKSGEHTFFLSRSDFETQLKTLIEKSEERLGWLEGTDVGQATRLQDDINEFTRRLKALELNFEKDLGSPVDWPENYKEPYTMNDRRIDIKVTAEDDSIQVIAERLMGQISASECLLDIETMSLLGEVLKNLGADIKYFKFRTAGEATRTEQVHLMCEKSETKIHAIKMVRSEFGVGLKEAKMMVDPIWPQYDKRSPGEVPF